MGLLRSRHEQLQGRLSVSAGQLDHQHAAEKSILRFAEGNYRGDVVRGFTLQIGQRFWLSMGQSTRFGAWEFFDVTRNLGALWPLSPSFSLPKNRFRTQVVLKADVVKIHELQDTPAPPEGTCPASVEQHGRFRFYAKSAPHQSPARRHKIVPTRPQK